MRRLAMLLVVITALFCTPLYAEDKPDLSAMPSMNAKVIDVIDGKTLVAVANGVEEKVVLIGVQTPAELHRERKEHFQKKVLPFLKRFTMNKDVQLKLAHPARDNQKRLQAYVFRKQDNLMVNFAIIRMGFGHALMDGTYAMKRNFRNAETDARNEGLGLWGRSLKTIHKEGKVARDTTAIHDDSIRVYLTIEDRKYHRDYCRQLQKSRYPFKLKDAKKAGYEPCKICLLPQ